MKDFVNKTVGEIVAQNIEFAKVFQSYGIDFCCGGDILLSEAVKKSGVVLDDLLKDLELSVKSDSLPQALNFDQWSLDLLIDYVVKFHHHYIRTRGTEIHALLTKVVNAHGDRDSHLHQVTELFSASLVDLHDHLAKEENILFPLIRELLLAQSKGEQLPRFHCGSVNNPIRVMIQEHDGEGDRFRKISGLTGAYVAPEYACNSYKLVLEELRQFEENLHIHIHVENNILFTKAIKLEESFG